MDDISLDVVDPLLEIVARRVAEPIRVLCGELVQLGLSIAKHKVVVI